MVIHDGLIYAMLISHVMFGTITNRAIANSSTTQVLLAVQVQSIEDVDTLVKRALENGAIRYKEPTDHGWMYFDSFEDPDGHQWEIMYSNPEGYS